MLSITIGGETPKDYKTEEDINIPSYIGISKEIALKYPDKFRIKIPKNTKNVYITWNESVDETYFEILEVFEERNKLKISISSWGSEFKIHVRFD